MRARRTAVIAALGLLLALPAGLAGAGSDERDERPTSSYDGRGDCEDCPGGPLGASLLPISEELRSHLGAPRGSGVLVSRIERGGPAEEGGLQVGDVVVEIDGRSVDSTRDIARVAVRRAGEPVELEIYRDGRPRVIKLTPRELEARREWRHEHRHHSDWTHGWEHDFDWEEFAEDMAELGAHLGALGAEIGLSVAAAVAAVDWEEIGRSWEEAWESADWDDIERHIEHSVEDSLEALERVDWDQIGDAIERSIEESRRALEELEEMDLEVDLEEMERTLEDLERELERLERRPS